jgi:hypothetical protein
MLFKELALNAAGLLVYEPYRRILFHIRKKSATLKKVVFKKKFSCKNGPVIEGKVAVIA